jgi:pilus assembly protein CpaF
MNLSERLKAVHSPNVSTAPPPTPAPDPVKPHNAVKSVPSEPASETSAAPATKTPMARLPQEQQTSTVDALGKLKDRAATALFERMGSRLNDPTLSEEQLHGLVRSELNHVVEEEKVPLTSEQRQRLIRDVQDDVLGHGPLQRLLDDPTVTEIMVNGPDMVYVEKKGKLTRSDARFASEEHLRRVIERIVSRVGRRIDESSPLVDARLADGSRVNAVIAPIASVDRH